MATTCKCGRAIPPQQGRGKPRKYCTTCAPPRDRRPAALKLVAGPREPLGSSAKLVGTAADPTYRGHQPSEGAPEPPKPGPVYLAALAELTEVGRETTSDGQVVLQLARAIDAGGGTAAGLAAAVREFAVAKNRAFDGATKVADVIDGLFGTG